MNCRIFRNVEHCLPGSAILSTKKRAVSYQVTTASSRYVSEAYKFPVLEPPGRRVLSLNKSGLDYCTVGLRTELSSVEN